MAKNKKTVTRAYGGSRCHGCVRNRYASLRALIVAAAAAAAGEASLILWYSRPTTHSAFKPLSLVIANGDHSIVRAFLIEEQKIVKRMLKAPSA